MKKINTPLISEFMLRYRDEYCFDTIATRHETLKYLSSSNQNKLILDVGTGSGWMSIIAAEEGHRVISIDIDTMNLVKARDLAKQVLVKNNKPLDFVGADALQLPFHNNSFEAVISFNAVHHLIDYSCPTGINEMIRVCKTPGDIIIADLNEGGVDTVQSLHAKAGLKHEENRCDVKELEIILNEIGLHMTRVDTPFVSIFHTYK